MCIDTCTFVYYNTEREEQKTATGVPQLFDVLTQKLFHFFFNFPFFDFAKSDGSSCSIVLPFVEKSRSALSLGVPPHLSPSNCSDSFNLSPPTRASSSADPNSLKSTG